MASRKNAGRSISCLSVEVASSERGGQDTQHQPMICEGQMDQLLPADRLVAQRQSARRPPRINPCRTLSPESAGASILRHDIRTLGCYIVMTAVASQSCCWYLWLDIKYVQRLPVRLRSVESFVCYAMSAFPWLQNDESMRGTKLEGQAP